MSGLVDCEPLRFVENIPNISPFDTINPHSSNSSSVASVVGAVSNASNANNASKRKGLQCEYEVIPLSKGSCQVTINDVTILCSVYGPQAYHRSTASMQSQQNMLSQMNTQGFVEVEVRYASFASLEHQGFGITKPGMGSDNKSQKSSISLLLSKQVKSAIEPAIRLNLYAKSCISIQLVILQTKEKISTGQELAAAVIATSLALCDAGIEMTDLVSACSLDYNIEAPPSSAVSASESSERPIDTITVTVCHLTRLNQVSSLLMNGRCSASQFNVMYQQCLKGCEVARETMDRIVRRRLTER